MATFDELVLQISLVELAEILHAKFYLYELMTRRASSVQA